jgi:hypothetical protein
MLYLSAPIVLPPDGVTFYPDHQNDANGEPLTWYYLPLSPRYSSDSQGPLVRLTKYVSDSDAFAVLDCDVNLGLDPAAFKTYVNKLKAAANLKGDPRIAPMQATAGTVTVMLLGRQSGQTGSSSLVSGISVPASPSLYNDNRAIFSIVLSPAGSDLVESTLKSKSEEEMTAVGVIYDLTFDTLRPAYAVKATASWNQVHKYLKDQFVEDGVFVGVDISKVVDDMKDKKIIDIQVDNLLTSDDQVSAVKGMLVQVKSLVFENFFRPVIERAGPKTPTFLDGVQNLMTRGARAVATFGLSELAHFQWNHEDKTELLSQTLTVDLHERSVVKMKLYPQAHLTQMVKDVSTPLVRELNATTGSEFFTKRNLQVDTNVPLSVDSISSIVVDLDYGGRRQSKRFTSTGDALPASQSVSWTSVLDDRRKMVRPVSASYTVNFQPRADASWPASLTSQPQDVTGDFWTVNPRTLYSVYPVRFLVVPDFPWDKFPVVTVHARYVDAKNSVNVSQVFSINRGTKLADQSTGVLWQIFQRDPTLRQYEYRLSYLLAGGGSTDVGSWVRTDAPLVILDPAKKDVWLMPPAVDQWPSDLQLITVQLTYDDAVNNLHLRPDVNQIFSGNKDPQKVRLLLADPSKQAFTYEATFYGNQTVKIPRSRTEDSVIRLSPAMKAHMVATVRADPAIFSAGTISKVVAKITPKEAKPSDAPTVLTFKSAADVGKVEYDFAQNGGYACKATYYYVNDDPFTARSIDVTDVDTYLIPVPNRD